MKLMDDDNNLKILIESGAKGKPINAGDMIGGIGQQYLDFKRIEKKVNNRITVHKHFNDDRPVARGFIMNSYYSGLEPLEMFIHLGSGREGLIDTALKTAVTGYSQRKIIKHFENILVNYDGSVRNGNLIMQLNYCDSNLNLTKQMNVKLNIINMNNIEIKNNFTFDDKEIKVLIKNLKLTKNNLENLNTNIYNVLIELRNNARLINIKKMYYDMLQDLFFQPVDYEKQILNVCDIKCISNTFLHPNYVIEQIINILNVNNVKLLYMSNKMMNDENSIKKKDDEKLKGLMKAFLYEYLNPKKMIFKYNLNKEKFDILIKNLIYKINDSFIESGEMIGIITGQSLGECLTQMSIIGSEQILILVKNKLNENIYVTKNEIGKIINTLFNYNKSLKNPNKTFILKNNIIDEEFISEDIKISDIDENTEYYIKSVDNNEKVKWTKISNISRHPVNGQLIRIQTNSGREITTTMSHSHLCKTLNGILPIEGKNLKIGDKIPISKKINFEFNNEKLDYVNFEFTFYNGYCIGSILNENNKNYNKYHIELTKCVNDNSVFEFVHISNIKFIKGILIGFFDNANIKFNKFKINSMNIVYLICHFENKLLLENISYLLKYVGIFSIHNIDNLNLEISQEFFAAHQRHND